jgi:hypothetical protein
MFEKRIGTRRHSQQRTDRLKDNFIRIIKWNNH